MNDEYDDAESPLEIKMNEESNREAEIKEVF